MPPTQDPNALLAELVAHARTQNSTLHTFKTGIIYGIGFVVGSSIIAAILINASLLIFGKYPLVRAVVELVQMQQ